MARTNRQGGSARELDTVHAAATSTKGCRPLGSPRGSLVRRTFRAVNGEGYEPSAPPLSALSSECSVGAPRSHFGLDTSRCASVSRMTLFGRFC